jgi:heterodisulfide reductase subunit C
MVTPDAGFRKMIDQEAKADINCCWTCGSCDFECPVHTATGRLRPQKLVRMANFGMIDELLHEPEIWYCQSCRRCLQICPNTVKPSELISHIRRIALERHIFSVDTIRTYRMLFARFQRARKQAVANCLRGKLVSISDRQWCDWLLSPAEEIRRTVRVTTTKGRTNGHFGRHDPSHAAACFTCGECSSSCPIACERSVFDPRTLFRMFNLGLMDEMLNSPAIWMCLECGRCTEACSQMVDGRDIIRRLKDHAVQKGIVDHNFFTHLEQANRLVYTHWLDEVDALFGFNNKVRRTVSTGFNDFSVCCRDYELATSA